MNETSSEIILAADGYIVYARAARSLASLDTGELLDEIVVTAGLRSVALASAPQSVTVLDAAKLSLPVLSGSGGSPAGGNYR